MAHKLNTTVPGLLGYRPQKGGGDAGMKEPFDIHEAPFDWRDFNDWTSPGTPTVPDNYEPNAW